MPFGYDRVLQTRDQLRGGFLDERAGCVVRQQRGKVTEVDV